MPLRELRDWLPALPSFEPSAEAEVWTDCCEESRAPLLASLLQRMPPARRGALILTPTVERAVRWHARLALLGIPEGSLHVLSTVESALYDDMPPDRQALSDRVGAMAALVAGGGIVLAVPQAALQLCLPREAFAGLSFAVRAGEDPRQELPQPLRRPSSDAIEALLFALTELGYEREDPVRRPGSFSRRGGIVDVYPYGSPLPVRLEFFGDEVESVRAFDVESQRSTTNLQSVVVRPGRTLVGANTEAAVAEVLRRIASLESSTASDLEEALEDDLSLLREGVPFDRLELYQPLLYERATLLDYARDCLIVVDDPLEVEIYADRAREDLEAALHSRMHRQEVPPVSASEYLGALEQIQQANRRLALTSGADAPAWFGEAATKRIGAQSLAPYRGRPESLASSLVSWAEQGLVVVVGTDQPTRAKQILSGLDLPLVEAPAAEPQPNAIHLASGNLAGGFAWPDAKFVLLTDVELFGAGRLRLPQRRFREGVPIASVLDLQPGDYVVHIQYGIGVYRGLTRRVVDGVEKEFLLIAYRQPDQLLLPVDQLDRIQKYLAPGDKPPVIHRITGGGWKRAVKSAREGAAELARELVEIYARRTQATRPPYGPDSPWQAEMEAAFPYMETPSQLKAIREIKRDMNRPIAMDRLVCGDVGFGKTEVAIRAAFKVVQAGKQVAVLCPTTILADQHYETFRERLAPYPVRIGLLNRFRTVAQRRSVLEGLADGSMDIVIGTHSLLQKNVRFANLGMVVVDEEQRFGVKHKEALKKLRINVDFLTLTATPIPRTLNMALMHIRDMSLIDDPPPGRLPVRTYLRPFQEEVVREALLRELARGGQAFYVYNRVQGIEHVAEKVRKLVPNARIAVAHGQMRADELEPIMMAFYRGEVDVLVCTTIIENGIDNPNVNTLIVDGADRLGMAQLYQLRGRVGRGDRQAYCYLTYRKGKRLTDAALARLKALEEFSQLGSGYALAFRDLQIRGAGELLGAKQSGFLYSVGYELYMELIHDAVLQLKTAFDEGGLTAARLAELREAQIEDARLPAFDVPVSAYLPTSYVEDDAQRLDLYRRLSLAKDEAALRSIHDELRDRFGPLPDPAQNAIELIRLRQRAATMGIQKVEGRFGRHIVWLKRESALPPRVLEAVRRRQPHARQMPDRIEWAYGQDALASLRELFDTLEGALAPA
jgi:transcription-repair coupling factor (superfamily II helicase)